MAARKENLDYCGEISIRGRRWGVPETPDALPEASGVPDEILEIMARRGVTDAERFLRPTLRDEMPDPYTLKGMEEAVARFCTAVRKRQRIAVWGDYDVDGATSTAVITRYLRMVGIDDSVFYIPDRMKEGYGPNGPGLRRLRDEGADLVVVVDSGTTALDALKDAVACGLEVIVLDHHEPDNIKTPQLPAILVNPKRKDEDRTYAYLCTAGLAFLFVVGVQRALREGGFFGPERLEPDLKPLLGIVALGTVCDMVPLVGLNRAYVRLGLPLMDRNLGLRALKKVKDTAADEAAKASGRRARKLEFTTYTSGYIFGPCINAGGRIGDTMLGSRLLTTDDEQEALAIAARLHVLNEERKQMQKEMVAQAARKVETECPGDKVIVLHDDVWHPGVVGLAASKIKDMFDRSTFVIGTGGKGSARAMPRFDIGGAIIEAFALDADQNGTMHGAFGIKSGGGHQAAGGITIDPVRIPAFRRWINERAKDYEPPPTRMDMVVRCDGLDHAVVATMELLEPFGMGNPRPRVAIVGGVMEQVSIMKGLHVKGILRDPDTDGSVEVILFHGVDTPLGNAIVGSQGRRIDVSGEISINDYNGAIQIIPDDVIVGAAASVDEMNAEAA